ncbi:MAG: ChbG/HpnK family deacetylase, partial [Clostridia bacterium]
MKQLIITADDYGMSAGVNEAIEQGVSAGLITSTNVMVNMEYLQEVSLLKKKFPALSVGLHWTLSAGKP